MPDQNSLYEIVGAQEICLITQVTQNVSGFAKVRTGVAQRLPEKPAATVREPESCPSVHPKRGRAQHGRERKIVFGGGEKSQKSRQILDREFSTEFEAIRPGIGKPAALQARMISAKSTERLWTRIRTSPAVIGRTPAAVVICVRSR